MAKRKITKGKVIIYTTQKTKDGVTRTPPKTMGELRCSGRVSSSCSTIGTTHVNKCVTVHEQHATGVV